MGAISRKGLRRIDLALNGFFGAKSLVAPKSPADFKVPNLLGRMLQLKGNRTLLLTDVGIAHLRAIVSTIDDENLFDGLASFSDVYSACDRTMEHLLSENQRPDGATEFLKLVRERLAKEIDLRTYAVPIHGVDLKGIEGLELGALRLVQVSRDFLESNGVKADGEAIDQTIASSRARWWLVGSAKGTSTVGQEKFRSQAELVVGVLAVTAAAMYEGGASGFRINIAMSPEEAYGRAAWFSWDATRRDLVTTMQFRRGQDFEFDASRLKELQDDGNFLKLLTAVQREKQNDLEETITRAVYWYADAHREAVPVMSLIKYWSCVEAFFSMDNDEITKSVSIGLASLLVFGGYGFVPFDEYKSTKKRIAKLYDLRSQAVHRGAHRHVSKRDAGELSQWVAWMLINLVELTSRGYTTVQEIREVSRWLDARAEGQRKP